MMMLLLFQKAHCHYEPLGGSMYCMYFHPEGHKKLKQHKLNQKYDTYIIKNTSFPSNIYIRRFRQYQRFDLISKRYFLLFVGPAKVR